MRAFICNHCSAKLRPDNVAVHTRSHRDQEPSYSEIEADPAELGEIQSVARPTPRDDSGSGEMAPWVPN